MGLSQSFIGLLVCVDQNRKSWFYNRPRINGLSLRNKFLWVPVTLNGSIVAPPRGERRVAALLCKVWPPWTSPPQCAHYPHLSSSRLFWWGLAADLANGSESRGASWRGRDLCRWGAGIWKRRSVPKRLLNGIEERAPQRGQTTTEKHFPSTRNLATCLQSVPSVRRRCISVSGVYGCLFFLLLSWNARHVTWCRVWVGNDRKVQRPEP